MPVGFATPPHLFGNREGKGARVAEPLVKGQGFGVCYATCGTGYKAQSIPANHPT